LALWDSTLAHARAHLPPEHPRLAETQFAEGSVLLKRNRATEAEPLLRAALESERTNLSDRDPAIAITTTLLGVSRAMRGDRVAGESLMMSAVNRLSGRKFMERQSADAQRVLDEWRAKWSARASTKE
jgi:hypothetical protein